MVGGTACLNRHRGGQPTSQPFTVVLSKKVFRVERTRGHSMRKPSWWRSHTAVSSRRWWTTRSARSQSSTATVDEGETGAEAKRRVFAASCSGWPKMPSRRAVCRRGPACSPSGHCFFDHCETPGQNVVSRLSHSSMTTIPPSSLAMQRASCRVSLCHDPVHGTGWCLDARLVRHIFVDLRDASLGAPTTVGTPRGAVTGSHSRVGRQSVYCWRLRRSSPPSLPLVSGSALASNRGSLVSTPPGPHTHHTRQARRGSLLVVAPRAATYGRVQPADGSRRPNHAAEAVPRGPHTLFLAKSNPHNGWPRLRLRLSRRLSNPTTRNVGTAPSGCWPGASASTSAGSSQPFAVV